MIIGLEDGGVFFCATLQEEEACLIMFGAIPLDTQVDPRLSTMRLETYHIYIPSQR